MNNKSRTKRDNVKIPPEEMERRCDVAMIRILARKRPKEFERVAKETFGQEKLKAA